MYLLMASDTGEFAWFGKKNLILFNIYTGAKDSF